MKEYIRTILEKLSSVNPKLISKSTLVNIDPEFSIEYFKKYYQLDENGKFKYKVSEIYESIEGDIAQLKGIHNGTSLVTEDRCDHCFSEMYLPLITRSDINSQRNPPFAICSCGHVNEPWCDCKTCKKMARIKQCEELKEKKSYFEMVIEECMNAPDTPSLHEYKDFFGEVYRYFKLRKKGRYNFKNIKKLRLFGLLTADGCIEFDIDKFLTEDYIEEYLRLNRYGTEVPLYDRDFLDFDTTQFITYTERIFNNITKNNFIGLLHKINDDKMGILRQFIESVGGQLGMDLTDLSEDTLINILVLQSYMDFERILYAAQGAIKNAYSYCQQEGIFGKARRNITVSILNKMKEKYHSHGWNPPERTIDKWELSEKHGISAETEESKAFGEMLNFFEARENEKNSFYVSLEALDYLKALSSEEDQNP